MSTIPAITKPTNSCITKESIEDRLMDLIISICPDSKPYGDETVYGNDALGIKCGTLEEGVEGATISTPCNTIGLGFDYCLTHEFNSYCKITENFVISMFIRCNTLPDLKKYIGKTYPQGLTTGIHFVVKNPDPNRNDNGGTGFDILELDAIFTIFRNELPVILKFANSNSKK
jgi:hypothetical protein